MTSESNAISSTTSDTSDFVFDRYTDAANCSPCSIIHAIIIPNYKEELDTLRETLEVLASHPQAHYSYDVSSCPGSI